MHWLRLHTADPVYASRLQQGRAATGDLLSQSGALEYWFQIDRPEVLSSAAHNGKLLHTGRRAAVDSRPVIVALIDETVGKSTGVVLRPPNLTRDVIRVDGAIRFALPHFERQV